MFIYVSGPYSARATEDTAKKNEIDANVKAANAAAIAIAKKGHFPFVPHTMMRGWEDEENVDRTLALNICKKWVEKCDALYFIATSPGADIERGVAEGLHIPIYFNLNNIPDVISDSNVRLSSGAVTAYLTEYEQCMDSYRHTYTTIWQAGSIFTAVSAALIAFASKSTDGAVPWWIQLLAPIPVLFWWWGIYWPMNRYGEWRSSRLKTIEKLLSNGGAASDLKMEHFLHFDHARKGNVVENERVGGLISRYFTERIIKLKFLWQPRVVEVVTVFGLAILFLEIHLIIKNWPKLTEWLKSIW
jgi:hypothetical protein